MRALFIAILAAAAVFAGGGGARAAAPCSPFTSFPLVLNFGNGANTGSGEDLNCALRKVQTAVNSLFNGSGQQTLFPSAVTMLQSLNVAPGAGFGSVQMKPFAYTGPFGGDQAQQSCNLVVGSGARTTGSPVFSCYRINLSIPTATESYAWAFHSFVNYVATGPSAAQHVASSAQMVKDAFAPGVDNDPELWSGLDSVLDRTGQGSDISGGLVGREVDVGADGPDPQKKRIGIVVPGTRAGYAPGPAELGSGMTVTSGDAAGGYGAANVFWNYGYVAAGAFKLAAFDTRQATLMSGARGIWFGDGHDITWNTSGSFQTLFAATTGRIETRFNTGVAHSIDSLGITRTNRVITAQACTNWGPSTVALLRTTANTPELKECDTAFATNGLKTGQNTGNGTGIPVYFSGNVWHNHYNDQTVAQ